MITQLKNRRPAVRTAVLFYRQALFSRWVHAQAQDAQLPQQPDFFGLRICRTAKPTAAATRSRMMMSYRFITIVLLMLILLFNTSGKETLGATRPQTCARGMIPLDPQLAK